MLCGGCKEPLGPAPWIHDDGNYHIKCYNIMIQSQDADRQGRNADPLEGRNISIEDIPLLTLPKAAVVYGKNIKGSYLDNAYRPDQN